MKPPLVSIIIPTYNRAHLIDQTIKSVMNQKYNIWELLICDDRSTDQTEKIVNDYRIKDNRIKYIKRSKDKIKGANTCRNIGLKESKGLFVKFLDSDDLLHPECLEKQVKELIENNIDASICKAIFFEIKNGEIFFTGKMWSKKLNSQKLIEDLVNGTVRWQTAAPLWRKNCLPKIPFKEGLMNSQEWLFHISMALTNTTFKIVPHYLCHIRSHEDSMSNVSKKKSSYFFDAAKARFFASEELKKHSINNNISIQFFLLKRFSFYHFYMLYKGGVIPFFKLFKYYPKLLLNLF